MVTQEKQQQQQQAQVMVEDRIFLKTVLEKEASDIVTLKLLNNYKIDFISFTDRPFKNANSIITSGVPQIFDCGKNLIFSYSNFDTSKESVLRSLMATYLDFHYLKNKCIIDIGDFIHIPNFELIKGYKYAGFYLVHPVYFNEVLSDNNYLWLIPIFKSEFEFLEKNGSDSFQDLLVDKNPDMSDLGRSPII
jgi:hypothetical protein